jgi:hypothetical protein
MPNTILVRAQRGDEDKGKLLGKPTSESPSLNRGKDAKVRVVSHNEARLETYRGVL